MKEYLLGLYEKSMPNYLNFEDKLKIAKECGFDFLEISIDESDEKLRRLDMKKEERLKLIETMYKVGVPIRSMCLSGHRKYPLGSNDEDIRKRGMDIMKKAIKFASDIGIRIIQIAGYDVYYEKSSKETESNFYYNLKKSVELASKYGVILAFETMETEFMNTVEKAMNYVNKINSPYLKVYPDTGNITNAALTYNKSAIEDIETGYGNISAVHLKESFPGKFREIPFGEGHVDFEKIIKKTYDLGVRRYLAEFWYVGNEDFKEVIKNTRKFMDDKFNKVLN